VQDYLFFSEAGSSITNLFPKPLHSGIKLFTSQKYKMLKIKEKEKNSNKRAICNDLQRVQPIA